MFRRCFVRCYHRGAGGRAGAGGMGGGGGGGTPQVDIPKTPNGQDPYTVFGVNPQTATLETIAKQYKKLVVENHPDRPGGSNDKMAEINAAHTILKENHDRIQQQLSMGATTARQQAQQAAEYAQQARATREEVLRRTGGIRSANQKNWKVGGDMEKEWHKFKQDTEQTAMKMIQRFELAVEQAVYMGKMGNLNELVARERWLVRGYCQTMWDDIHAMKQEAMRHGARSRQQRDLADDMMSFGTTTESKLRSNFKRTATYATHRQVRKMAQRGIQVVGALAFAYVFCSLVFGFWWRNSLAVKLKPALGF
eukprot:PhM_4_TR14607/c0_g1_i1/m.31483